jgi:signal peptidase I
MPMNGLLKFLLWTVGILGALGVILYATLFDVWVLPTDDPQFVTSVEPTLSGGDTVLLSRHGTPSFANLVRCPDPDAAGRFVVGRLVGSGGDKLSLVSETINVNGQHVSSPSACLTPQKILRNPSTGADETLDCFSEEIGGSTVDVLRSREHPEGQKDVEVEPAKVYLLSDNRHMHLDSRDYGAIPKEGCQHIVFRLWGGAGYGDAKHRFSIIW